MTESHPTVDELVEPLTAVEAKKLIVAILKEGSFGYRRHATQRIEERSLNTVDVVNVLRAGSVDEPDFENGTWRYRVRTELMTVVIAFRSRARIVVITAWRNQ